MDVGKVVAGPVHGDLAGPTVESARDVYLPAAVLPAEHRGDRVVVVELGQRGEIEGLVCLPIPPPLLP